MIAKLLWLIPLITLVVLLCIFTLGSASPLSSLGRYVHYDWGYNTGVSYFTLLVSMVFYYLLVFGALSLLTLVIGISPWIRGGISLVVALLIAGYTIISGIGAGIAAAGGNIVGSGDEAMRPLVKVEKMLFLITSPLRMNHYRSHLEDADPKVAEKVFSEVFSLSGGDNRKHDVELIRVMAKAFNNSTADYVRDYLTNSLVESETNDSEALLTIASALTSPTADYRKEAVLLLGKLKAALPGVIDALRAVATTDPDLDVRHLATEALTTLAPQDKQPEALALAAIERGDPWGAQVLYDLNKADPRVPAALDRFLKDKRPALRAAWLDAVHSDRLDLEPGTALRSTMLKLTRDPDASVRAAAIRAVTDAFYDDTEALRPTLLKLTRDPDVSVRAEALKAVTRAFPRDAEVLQAFVETIEDPKDENKVLALAGIEASRSKEPRITRALLKAVQDCGDPERRKILAFDLSKCDLSDPQIQLAVIAVIRDSTEGVDFILSQGLSLAELRAPAVLDALAKLLENPNPRIRAMGAKILGSTNVQNASVQLMMVRVLAGLEDYRNDWARQEVTDALSHIDPLSAQAIAELKRLVQSPDEGVANSARYLLMKLKEP
jgi:hypothetical protein